jgi:hypothetical protein
MDFKKLDHAGSFSVLACSLSAPSLEYPRLPLLRGGGLAVSDRRRRVPFPMGPVWAQQVWPVLCGASGSTCSRSCCGPPKICGGGGGYRNKCPRPVPNVERHAALTSKVAGFALSGFRQGYTLNYEVTIRSRLFAPTPPHRAAPESSLAGHHHQILRAGTLACGGQAGMDVRSRGVKSLHLLPARYPRSMAEEATVDINVVLSVIYLMAHPVNQPSQAAQQQGRRHCITPPFRRQRARVRYGGALAWMATSRSVLFASDGCAEALGHRVAWLQLSRYPSGTRA